MTRFVHVPLDAFILVGGKGTRLRQVVSDRPKPMAEVSGRPFVEWLLLALRNQGVRRVVFCTGHMAGMIEDHFHDGGQWDMEVVYSRDPNPLGTAGAIRHALGKLSSERVLVMNGDSYCKVDVQRLHQAHIDRQAFATMWLTRVEDRRRYGTVEIDEDDRVRSFREKSIEKLPGLVNAGVYVLERSVLEAIPDGVETSLESDVFPSLIGRGLYGVVGDGLFLDIGTPDSYAAAQQLLSEDGIGVG